MNKQKIGFVGLGSMGSSMVSHILKKGYEVYGFDTNPDRIEALKGEGIKTSSSLVSVAGELDVVILMVVENEQTESILFGTDSVAQKMKSGSTVISCSTLSPLYVKELGEKLEKLNIALIDCPVSGGHVGAKNGTLTLMLSAKNEHVEKVRDILDAFSSKIYFVGDKVGMGSTLKVVHQHLASTHIALTVEALGLCKKAGIDPKYFFDVVTHSAGTSKIFETFAPLLIEKDYSPHSSVDVTEKDLRLVIELAKSLDYKASIVEEAYNMYNEGRKQGLGKLSPVATIKLLNVDWE